VCTRCGHTTSAQRRDRDQPIVAAPASAIPLDALQLTARVQLGKRPHAQADVPLDELID
jgi:hypothetical protein